MSVGRIKDSDDPVEILRNLMPHIREKYGVSSLGVFGSWARNEQRDESDIDKLVTFRLLRLLSLFLIFGLMSYGVCASSSSDIPSVPDNLSVKAWEAVKTDLNLVNSTSAEEWIARGDHYLEISSGEQELIKTGYGSVLNNTIDIQINDTTLSSMDAYQKAMACYVEAIRLDPATSFTVIPKVIDASMMLIGTFAGIMDDMNT